MCVLAPHAGKCLSHCTEGLLNCALLCWSLAGSQLTCAILVCKDLQDWDGDAVILKEGVHIDASTEVCPEGPKVSIRLCSGSTDTMGGVLCSSKECISEVIMCGGRSIVHDGCMG